ncbi:MAG TPA: nitrite reductase small subunit NirD [Melioribacteraceae bacterium]|nr:nitrite reductase small subunit NirD [Melioribacteraceae bacterium]
MIDDNIPEGFAFVCTTDELKENRGKKFIINDEEIALFYVNNKYYATSNMCPHQHARIIYDGFIEDNKVICPAHGWEFDLETGKQPGNRKGLRVFETYVLDKRIFVKVIPQTFNW